MAAKKKVNFEDRDNLLVVEGLARDGLDNKDIASYFNYTETYFSGLVNSIHELSEALKRGRKPLSIVVETSLYRRAIGAVKVKTITKKYIETPCPCAGEDKYCEKCGGIGKIVTDSAIITETESELPPDTGAAAFWLKQRKPEIWNKQPTRIDATTNGKDVAPEAVKVEIVFNKAEDVELQENLID